ncbi:MAG TPA: class IV adenylate cyclase [Candidatus Paceibacterota bacterium]
MYEVEVKAAVRDRDAVVRKLESLGCKFSEELHQVDRIFIPEGAPFPPPVEMKVGVLRVRKQNSKTNDKYSFTLKIPQTSRQDSLEREMEIKDGEMMIEILKLLKYQEVPTVDKKRVKTKYQDMEIVLDDVKNLGEFIEAEKIVQNHDHEDRKKTQEELFTFLEILGISKSDRVIDGKYDIMLFEKLGMK